MNTYLIVEKNTENALSTYEANSIDLTRYTSDIEVEHLLITEDANIDSFEVATVNGQKVVRQKSTLINKSVFIQMINLPILNFNILSLENVIIENDKIVSADYVVSSLDKLSELNSAGDLIPVSLASQVQEGDNYRLTYIGELPLTHDTCLWRRLKVAYNEGQNWRIIEK